MFHVVARTLAGLIGVFVAASVVLSWRDPTWDATVWLFDLRVWPGPLRESMLLGAAGLWLGFAARPAATGSWRSRTTVAVTLLFAAVALVDAARFAWLLSEGRIGSTLPVPISLAVAAAAGGIAWAHRPSVVTAGRYRAAGVSLVTVGVALLGFTLGQVFCFGKTDYRRAADAIVVFGARAYANGRPSDALADRVRTACDLYHAGYAPLLVMSGGPGDGDVHETESMRRLAVSLGVPDKAIVTDRGGVNTRATVRATAAYGRILTVSHFYHLPRVKLTYQRAGVEVFTVPARERYTLTKMPLLIAREVAAIWYYAFTA